MNDKLSRKILDQALEQQDELEAEYGPSKFPKSKNSLEEARTSLGSTQHDESSDEELSDENDQYYEDVVRTEQLFMSQKTTSVCILKSFLNEPRSFDLLSLP